MPEVLNGAGRPGWTDRAAKAASSDAQPARPGIPDLPSDAQPARPGIPDLPSDAQPARPSIPDLPGDA